MGDKLTIENKIFKTEIQPGTSILLATSDTYVDKNIKIEAALPDISQFGDDDLREELVDRGYDVPLNKSDAYYRAIAESKYRVINSIIKQDSKYPRIDLEDFVDFNASEYQVELYGYIMKSTVGTTSFFSSRIDGNLGGKFDFQRNKSGNVLRFVRNGVQAYISNFNTDWHTFYLGDDGLKVDGTLTAWQGAPQTEQNCTYPVCLFASNPMSSTDFSIGNNCGEVGFKYLKFFHFGKLVCYFFPILLDNEVCLYDVVGDRVYRNTGSDYFITDDPSVDLSTLETGFMSRMMPVTPSSDD